MGRKRYMVEQIIGQLREAEIELGRGLTTPQACLKIDKESLKGIAEKTECSLTRVTEGMLSICEEVRVLRAELPARTGAAAFLDLSRSGNERDNVEHPAMKRR